MATDDDVIRYNIYIFQLFGSATLVGVTDSNDGSTTETPELLTTTIEEAAVKMVNEHKYIHTDDNE